jgi:hypothetical protein
MQSPALVRAGAARGALGVYLLPESLQGEDRIAHLSPAAFTRRGIPHRVESLRKVVGPALQVGPADPVRLAEIALPFRGPDRAVQRRSLGVRVGDPRPPCRRRRGRPATGGRAGGQQDDAQEGEGAEDDPQPDEVGAGTTA